MSPRTLFTSEYCPPGHYSPVNNVPPRVRVSRWSGVIILHYKWQRGTCKDRTTAQLTIRGEIQLTLVSRAQAFWTSFVIHGSLSFRLLKSSFAASTLQAMNAWIRMAGVRV